MQTPAKIKNKIDTFKFLFILRPYAPKKTAAATFERLRRKTLSVKDELLNRMEMNIEVKIRILNHSGSFRKSLIMNLIRCMYLPPSIKRYN